MTANNDQLADVILRAETGDLLNDAEYFQYASGTRAMFRYFENVHYQYRQGLYDPDEFAAQLEAWRSSGYAQIPAAQSIWCESRAFFSPDFRAAFDDVVAREC